MLFRFVQGVFILHILDDEMLCLFSFWSPYPIMRKRKSESQENMVVLNCSYFFNMEYHPVKWRGKSWSNDCSCFHVTGALVESKEWYRTVYNRLEFGFPSSLLRANSTMLSFIHSTTFPLLLLFSIRQWRKIRMQSRPTEPQPDLIIFILWLQ